MKSILLFSFVCYVNCINWKDCGDSKAVLHYSQVSLSPDPIIYPDPIDVKMDISITEAIPSENLKVKISIDKTSPKRMHIPCINGFGSCDYDYCDYAKKNADSKDLLSAFAKIQCPLKAQKQSLTLPGRAMPKLGSVFEKILEGGFDTNVTFVNSKTGQVYGCVHAEFELKLKS